MTFSFSALLENGLKINFCFKFVHAENNLNDYCLLVDNFKMLITALMGTSLF